VTFFDFFCSRLFWHVWQFDITTLLSTHNKAPIHTFQIKKYLPNTCSQSGNNQGIPSTGLNFSKQSAVFLNQLYRQLVAHSFRPKISDPLAFGVFYLVKYYGGFIYFNFPCYKKSAKKMWQHYILLMITTISSIMSILLDNLHTQLMPNEARWLPSWWHLVKYRGHLDWAPLHKQMHHNFKAQSQSSKVTILAPRICSYKARHEFPGNQKWFFFQKLIVLYRCNMGHTVGELCVILYPSQVQVMQVQG